MSQQGPCARCLKGLDLRKGDTVWFCMQCPDIGGPAGRTGYTYWLCTTCYEEHGEKDHDLTLDGWGAQHHLGSHRFLDMSESDDVIDSQKGYREFLELGVPLKYIRLMDGAFEMLKLPGQQEVSAGAMAEHLAASVEDGNKRLIHHPGGAQGAMADALGLESTEGVWLDRDDFIKAFIVMTRDGIIDADDLFQEFQSFLCRQPKRVVTLDATTLPTGEVCLTCNGIGGRLLAPMTFERTTSLLTVKRHLASSLECGTQHLEFVTTSGTLLATSAGATVGVLVSATSGTDS